MKVKPLSDEVIKKIWYSYLTTGELPEEFPARWYERKMFKPLIRWMPKSPRCDVCYIPFEGIGGEFFKRFTNVRRSKLLPRLCTACENFAEDYHGGVELEFSILFVDIRGSTTLAEQMTPEQYSKVIQRFYQAAAEEYYRGYGMVEKLLGDGVAGFFVPGFAGPNHAKAAIETGKRIMKAIGYGSPSGPWTEVGMGVNTGLAYIGSVTTQGGVSNIAMLGDAVNIAARLTAQAEPGELIMSESTRLAAGMGSVGILPRNLQLKGKSEEVETWVLKFGG